MDVNEFIERMMKTPRDRLESDKLEDNTEFNYYVNEGALLTVVLDVEGTFVAVALDTEHGRASLVVRKLAFQEEPK